MKTKLILVDDEVLYLRSLSRSLSADYEISTYENGKEFVTDVVNDNLTYDLILLDYSLRDSTAEEIIPAVLNHDESAKIILISGEADVEQVISCVRKGAYDYLEKPISLDNLRIKIKNAVAMLRIERERTQQRARKLDLYAIVGESTAIQNLRNSINKIARTDATVLITGESGTGKELVAHQLHYRSQRAGQPMNVINCAAISKELAGSMLFGHVKGAFTGAIQDSIGHAELADKGTLFLDEIGDMPLEIQAQLLRFLETGEFHRIGETTVRTSDVRIIAATNQSLVEMIDQGTFRKDLFYRLNVYNIHTPSLKDFRSDIPDLVMHFLQQFIQQGSGTIAHFTTEALSTLQSLPWPGNVRELKHFISKAIVLTEGETIDHDDIEQILACSPTSSSNQTRETVDPLDRIMAATERETLLSRLNAFHGDVSAAAESLGIHRSNLYRKAARHNIEINSIK